MTCLQGPPLPEPRWGEFEPYIILTYEEHKRLVHKAEEVLRVLLCNENYDSVHSLLNFYEAYEREGPTACLYNIFKKYKPELSNNNFTCVGLGLELIKKWHELDNEFPDFANSSHLVSCEQDVLNVDEYVQSYSPNDISRIDKEHVLVCVNVEIEERPGVILADPGYHVAQVITVMMDGGSPNSGRITLIDRPNIEKLFYYHFNHTNYYYVEWHKKKMKDDIVSMETSLIYVGRPYLDAINVTIRRNLVYEYRSIVARNESGCPLAGVYFKICPIKNEFTLFEEVDDRRLKFKHEFTLFNEGEVIPEPVLAKMTKINTILNFEEGELIKILRKVAYILKDQRFITQMLGINNYIQNYARDVPPETEGAD